MSPRSAVITLIFGRLERGERQRGRPMAGIDTDPVGAVHAYRIQGLEVRTGDLICTTDGGRAIGRGEFWWLVAY
jgi:hypothetical protein